MPEGTEIIHNPTRQERDQTIGFPDESKFMERHGRHFHLIGGRNRIVIEMATTSKSGGMDTRSSSMSGPSTSFLQEQSY